MKKKLYQINFYLNYPGSEESEENGRTAFVTAHSYDDAVEKISKHYKQECQSAVITGLSKPNDKVVVLQDKEEVKECERQYVGGKDCNCVLCKNAEKLRSTPPIPEKLEYDDCDENNETNVATFKSVVNIAKRVNTIIDYLHFITKKR